MSLPQPADEIVYPDQINNDFLFELFSSAYMSVKRDEVGDIFLKGNFTSWIFPQQDGEQIRLMAQFKASVDVSLLAKLEYANMINDRLRILRAYVDSDEDIGFDYYIPVEGGITKRNIVMSVRRFVDYVQAALSRDEQDVIG